MNAMKISELFDSKKAVWSFEIFPPKPTAEIGGVERIVRELAELAPDYISVTCSAGGSGNSRTPEIAGIVKRAGVEPLAHLTCINSVRAEVDGALDKLAAEGVDNVLALRGDRIAGASDSPDFRHAVDLVRHIRARGEGVDIAGACYPECHPESETPEDDIRYLKEKVDAGVSHLNTQLFFDNEAYFAFLERLRAAGVSVPVQAGIMPLVKKSHVDRMIGLSGANIPARLSRIIARFYDDPASLMEAGIAYATEQIMDLLSAGADGIHLYVMHNVYVARKITENVRDVLDFVNGDADRR